MQSALFLSAFDVEWALSQFSCVLLNTEDAGVHRGESVEGGPFERNGSQKGCEIISGRPGSPGVWSAIESCVSS